MVGLGNVDNTSDANKPISTWTQTALNGKQNALTSSTDVTVGSITFNVVQSTGTSGKVQRPVVLISG